MTADQEYGGPLSGLRVVDLCWVYAGPVMTRMLADLGAEVIKVESRQRPDGTRLGRRPLMPNVELPEGSDIDLECQPLNHALNRNKHGITVDLSRPEGKALILELVAISDIVTDNFAAGTMERMGLGYEQLSAARRDIIALSLSGAGQFGPLRNTLAYASTLAALGGVGLLVGDQRQTYGVMAPTYGDSNAAIRAAGAIMIALYNRQRTGEGQYIDVSEWETTMTGLDEAFLAWQLRGEAPRAEGNESAVFAPHNNYQCGGDDEWVAIAIRSDAEWATLCHMMSMEELANDSRFVDIGSRIAHASELDAIVEAWTLSRGAGETASELQMAGIAAFKVCSVEDQYGDMHFHDRDVFAESVHDIVGFEIVPGMPFRYRSKRPGSVSPIRRPAPTLGKSNRYVLCELLGKSDSEFERLGESGVLY